MPGASDERIAILYLQLYQDKKAIYHARKALELAPKGDASGWARLGIIYSHTGIQKLLHLAKPRLVAQRMADARQAP